MTYQCYLLTKQKDNSSKKYPSLEDIDEDIQAEVSGDTLGYVRGISRCVEETWQTYVFVAEINAITMAPATSDIGTVGQFIQEILPPIKDNIPKEATALLIKH